MKVLRMADTDLRNKRVLIREDLNVPVQDGVVTSDARIRAALATIRYAVDQHARVFVISHLGRPKEGQATEALTLAPVAVRLSELLGKPVRSEEHTSELQSQSNLVCRLLLEKKKKTHLSSQVCVA